MKKEVTIQSLEKRIQAMSIIVARNQLATSIGIQSYGGDRDIYQALGYLTTINYQDYKDRYLRQDIAKAVIDRPVKATWRGELCLIESDNDNETELEKKFDELNKKLKLKSVFARADRLASIGRYGVIYLGLDDIKTTEDYAIPVKKGQRVLKSVRPFGEGSALIGEYESDVTNERYGMPLFYNIQVVNTSGSSSTIKVHYSRILHIVEDPLESEIEGMPSMESIFNCLMDIEKISGGDAEMFWRGARPGMDAAVKDDYHMTADDETDLKDQFDEYEHNLRRILRTKGIELKQLEQQVADPSTHMDIQLQKISAATEIPKRILTGSERGELASSQDQDEWNTYVQARRDEYAEPNIVRPFVDRCIELQILPEPATDYDVDWSDLFAISEAQQVEIGLKRATALNQYSSNGISQQIVSPEAFLEYFGGFSQEDIELIQEMNSAEVLLELEVSPEEQELIGKEIE